MVKDLAPTCVSFTVDNTNLPNGDHSRFLFWTVLQLRGMVDGSLWGILFWFGPKNDLFEAFGMQTGHHRWKVGVLALEAAVESLYAWQPRSKAFLGGIVGNIRSLAPVQVQRSEPGTLNSSWYHIHLSNDGQRREETDCELRQSRLWDNGLPPCPVIHDIG